MSNDDTIELNAEISKRKLLGGLGVLGGATAFGGAGTLALLSDSESLGSSGNANIIQGGEVDLEVDWEVVYFGPGSSPKTIDSQTEPVDRPGPIVDVTDLKPGDIIEKTLSTHINGNPAFLTFDLSVLADEDNGINDPEDAVDGEFNDSDGTEGGDIAENLNCVVWYDGFEDSEGNNGGTGGAPGNNRPDEGSIWKPETDPTNDEEFEAALDSAGSPSDVFDIESNLVIASGTLAELATAENPILIDSRDQGAIPADYGDSACYDNGAVQYIGCLCWLPRDIPSVDDNIIQTDRLEYQFGFGAIQCRDNVADDGTPINTDVATHPGGGGGSGPEISLGSLTGTYMTGQEATVSGTASGGVTEVALFALGPEFWWIVELDGELTLPVTDGNFSTQATLSGGSTTGNDILSATGNPYIGVIDTADIAGTVALNTAISRGDFADATTDREQIQVEAPSVSLNQPSEYVPGQEAFVSGTASGDVTEVAIFARDKGPWEVVELDGQFILSVTDGSFSTQATLSSGSGGGNDILSTFGSYDIGVIDTADIAVNISQDTTISTEEFAAATTDERQIDIISN